MPTSPNRLPKYRFYKPKGLAVVRIDGKDHYLGKHNSPESWEKYHRLLAAHSTGAVLASPQPLPSSGITVSELVLAFWNHAKSYYVSPDGTPAAEQANIKLSLRPLRMLIGLTPASEFGPLALKTIRNSMIDSGLARTTINYRVGKIVRVFKWAVENELVPPSSRHTLKAVTGLRKGRTTAPEPESVKPVSNRLVDAIRPFVTRQVWVMIELQRLTAARSGELAIMRTGDIEKVGEEWVYRPRTHKTAHHGQGRAIVLGPFARTTLSPFLKADLDTFVFSPADAVAERNALRREALVTPLTPSHRKRRAKARPLRPPGTCYSKNAYRNAIWRGCDRAFPHPTLSQIPAKEVTPEQRAELKIWRREHRWHPHQLRHSAATLIRGLYGLEAAQVVLGHAKADVTPIYAERDLSKALKVMREIG